MSRSRPSCCILSGGVLIITVLLQLTSAVPHAVAEGGTLHCTDHYMLYGTSCYRYFGHETKKAFHYAQKLCWRHQSSLVSILTSEEETFVVQLAENNTSFWIGLDDLDGPELKHKEGIFKWSTGESIEDTESYVNWQWGEPNNRQHLDCVKADFSGWAMASGGCASTKLPFICKKRACPEGLSSDGTKCNLKLNDPSWLVSNALCCCVLVLTFVCVVLITCTVTCSRLRSYNNNISNFNVSNSRKHLPIDKVQDLYPT